MNVDPWADQFPDDYVPIIFKLILKSWKTFSVPPKRLEVPITKKLCAHLRTQKKPSHLFLILWESCELDSNGNEKGRIDLKFYQSGNCREHVYFSIECKRLHVPYPSGRISAYASVYVTEGMYRYFNGQYAEDLNKGGMLGYVMDGKVKKARENVKKAIEARRSDLHMGRADTIEASTISKDSRVFQTRHNYPPKDTFMIYHVLLAATKK